MHGRYILPILAVLVCSSSIGDDASPKLSVQFATAEAKIAPRAPDKPVQFPDMTFTLQATASCPAAELPASVSVSIADSRITIAPGDDGRFEEEILVSAQQLGPIVARDFCLDNEMSDPATDESENQPRNTADRESSEASGEQPDYNERMQIRGALSAQLSLRCKGENSESISYATEPLNVELLCKSPEQSVTELQEIEL